MVIEIEKFNLVMENEMFDMVIDLKCYCNVVYEFLVVELIDLDFVM